MVYGMKPGDKYYEVRLLIVDERLKKSRKTLKKKKNV